MGLGRGRNARREPRRLDRFRSGRNTGRAKAARRRNGAGLGPRCGWTRDAAEPLTELLLPVPRRPAGRPLGPPAARVTVSSSASRTSTQGSPPPVPERGRPTYPGPKPHIRLLVVGPVDGLRVPQVPGPAPRADPPATSCVLTRRPGRWRNRTIDAGTVSPPAAPHPVHRGASPPGGEWEHSAHDLGILSRTKRDLSGVRREAGHGRPRPARG